MPAAASAYNELEESGEVEEEVRPDVGLLLLLLLLLLFARETCCHM